MKFETCSKYTSKQIFRLPVLQLSHDWVFEMFFAGRTMFYFFRRDDHLFSIFLNYIGVDYNAKFSTFGVGDEDFNYVRFLSRVTFKTILSFSQCLDHGHSC